MHWWTTLVTIALESIGKSTGRQIAIGAALFLILLGIVFGSTAAVIFGGALLVYLLSRPHAQSG